jgi:hypothetical protein
MAFGSEQLGSGGLDQPPAILIGRAQTTGIGKKAGLNGKGRGFQVKRREIARRRQAHERLGLAADRAG